MTKSKEELNNLLMKVKEESEKSGLKLNSQNTKIMASNSITSWQQNGAKVEAVIDFIFLDYKITTDDVCSHKIKRRLLLGGKAMTNLDSILKSRDNFLDRGAVVFPVVTYGCESCIIKRLSTKELILLNCGAGEDS